MGHFFDAAAETNLKALHAAIIRPFLGLLDERFIGAFSDVIAEATTVQKCQYSLSLLVATQSAPLFAFGRQKRKGHLTVIHFGQGRRDDTLIDPFLQ